MTETAKLTPEIIQRSDAEHEYRKQIGGLLTPDGVEFVYGDRPADTEIEADSSWSHSQLYSKYVDSLASEAKKHTWWANRYPIDPSQIVRKHELHARAEGSNLALGADVYDVAGETDPDTLHTIREVFQRVDNITGNLLSRGLMNIVIIHDETIQIAEDPRVLASVDDGIIRIKLPLLHKRALETDIDTGGLLDHVLTHELGHHVDVLLGGRAGQLASQQFIFSSEKTDSDTRWGEIHDITDPATGEPVHLPHVYAGVNPSEFTAIALEHVFQTSGKGEYTRTQPDKPIADFADNMVNRARQLAWQLSEELGVTHTDAIGLGNEPIDGKVAVEDTQNQAVSRVIPDYDMSGKLRVRVKHADPIFV